MRLLLADGAVVTLGGKVVKNVAGYDLPRLVLGSWGTFGVILEATFKLHARPVDVPLSLPPRPARRAFGPWALKVKVRLRSRRAQTPSFSPRPGRYSTGASSVT